jgi:hypothetical protein
MFAVPLMHGDGNLDVTNLLKTLRAQQGLSETMIKHDVKAFNQMRLDVLAIKEPTETSQKLLLKYFHQVKSLAVRFKKLESQMTLNFSWNDPLVVNQKCTSSSFYFEEACVLWNLAATESILGMKMDRTTDDLSEQTWNHYQQAAGYFDYLKGVLLPKLLETTSSNNLPRCFNNEHISIMKLLMLAQGQFCHYEKAVRDKKKSDPEMKTETVAQIAAQTALYYANTATAIANSNDSLLSTILENKCWLIVTEYCSKSFRGAAEYWQGVFAKESTLFDAAVARFDRAESCIRAAIEVIPTLTKDERFPALVQKANSFLQLIQTSRVQAQDKGKMFTAVYKDRNIQIDSNSLAEIEGLSLVEVLPVPENINSSVGILALNDLFFNFLIPEEVLQAIAQFHDEMESKFTEVRTKIDTSSQAGRAILNSIEGKLAFEANQDEANRPSVSKALWDQIKTIQNDMGSHKKLNLLILELKNLSVKANSTLLALENRIKSEETKENGVNRSDLEDIKDIFLLLKDSYQKALKQDEKILVDFEVHNAEGKLLLLTKTKEELNKLLDDIVVNPVLTLAPFGQEICTGGDSKVATETMMTISSDKHDITQMMLADLKEKVKALPVEGKTPSMVSSSAGDRENALDHEEKRQLEKKLKELTALFDSYKSLIDQMMSFLSIPTLQNEVTLLYLQEGDMQEVFNQYKMDIRVLMVEIDQNFLVQDRLINEIMKLMDFVKSCKEKNPIFIERMNFVNNLEEMVQKYFTLHSQLTTQEAFYTKLMSKLTTLQKDLIELSRASTTSKSGLRRISSTSSMGSSSTGTSVDHLRRGSGREEITPRDENRNEANILLSAVTPREGETASSVEKPMLSKSAPTTTRIASATSKLGPIKEGGEASPLKSHKPLLVPQRSFQGVQP